MHARRRSRKNMEYAAVFLGAAIITALVTPLVIKAARRFGVLDVPGEPRKIHSQPTPLLGGLAPFLGLVVVIGAILWFAGDLVLPEIPLRHLVGVGIGALFLMIGGFFDDLYDLKPRVQIIFPVLAALAIVVSGIGIREITNPFGGTFRLDVWAWFPDVFTFVWLMGMMYTTKFLDGLDGLVSGLTVIGALMVFLLTQTIQWYQPEVGVLAIAVAGAFAGFLVWNWNPAKIFLGTGGSTLAGFLLGTLAIISGGKIATTLLVFGVPILDAAWVISRRVFLERKSPTQADRKHLHFRLLDSGFSHRAAVITLYAVAALFGALTLVLQSKEKLMTLIVLVVLMIVGGTVLVRVGNRRK